ncbi:MAG: hypothetical protein ACREDR_43755, partial [Blastocatellia bacterium]
FSSAWAIASPQVTASQSFTCDRGRQAGTNELAAFNSYIGRDPINSCWRGAVGWRNTQSKDACENYQQGQRDH